jgi:hypothetical protein
MFPLSFPRQGNNVKTARIIDILPECYSNFLPSFFASQITVESAATCRNCAMLEKTDSLSHAPKFFSARTKCCTHHPEIPSYLVGAIISSTDPDHETGRRRMIKRISDKTSITPLGVLRPKKFNLLIKNSSLDYFGRSEKLLCPFYESSGLCTLSTYWDAVCSTWFCKHNSGEEGMRFWRALRKYLENLERILARYLLLKMDFRPALPIDESTSLSLQELDDLPPLAEHYDKLWGDWAGREEEFFIASYKEIKGLSQEDFAVIEGVEQKLHLRALEQAYVQMTEHQIPGKLKKNPELSTEKISDDSYLLGGYSPFDPLKVSKRLYDCLDLFDGLKSNLEVVTLCREKLNIKINDEILKKLYQFRVLISAN